MRCKGNVTRLIRLCTCAGLVLPLLIACAEERETAPKDFAAYGSASWSLKSYQGKPPTEFTASKLRELEAELPKGDFADGSAIADHSREELIANLPKTLGGVNFDAHDFSALDTNAPIHPSLSGITKQLQNTRGLFKLAANVYQIRGGLAYITLVRGKRGWIVLDTGMTQEFSADAWAFAQQHLPGGTAVPISSVIYSHSHVDHFGGVKGLVDSSRVQSGELSVIAPHGFMAHALAENVIAGSAMFRRANYHFGSLLTPKLDGTEYYSFLPAETGSVTLIRPTLELPQGPGKVTPMLVDGVPMEFMDVSGAEAPAATLIYLPENNLIFNSELMFQGQHNIYTLRGAAVRDALAWSKLINKVIARWGAEVDCFTGPHGPSFCGNDKIVEYMGVQRDNYGFVHNQTVRLMNSGMKLQNVGQSIEQMVPESLSSLWHTHGYHGTYSHNARGVLNRYLGFYDANPANLNPLPIKEEAIKYVQYMGGAGNIIQTASADFANGEYRFVASVLGKLVSAQPDYWPARHLLADAFEQLGYQSEGPQWRNAYLSAAKELRVGRVLNSKRQNDASDLFAAASAEEILDALAVRVNSSKAEGKHLTILLELTDVEETWWLELKNGNLSSISIKDPRPADAILSITLYEFVKIASGQAKLKEMLSDGLAGIDGSMMTMMSLLLTLESDNTDYVIVGG